jgi:hypothetical protein
MKMLAIITVAFILFASAGFRLAQNSQAGSGGISPLTGEAGYAGEAYNKPVYEASLYAVPAASALILGGLYGTDGSNLYIIDKTTGSATLIGPHGSIEVAIGALAFDETGVLYGISLADNARLYTIDPTTGAATSAGALGIGFVYEGGLDFDASGQLFGVNRGISGDGKLFTVDKGTGTATVVGPTTEVHRDINGLAFDGQTFYAIDNYSNTFGSIEPTTGVYTSIGNTGATIGPAGALAIDPADGKIYASFNSGGGFYTIDKATGDATLIDHNYVDYGLAFAPLSKVFLPLTTR